VAGAPPQSNDRHPTILVADDDEAIRQVLGAQLAARGYLICQAGSGEEVLQAVTSLRPDVIVLDLGLPGVDGIEVTRRLRLSTQTPIIILSVRAAESDKIAALDAGADDYLTKPCQTGDLLERIRTALFRTTFAGALFESGALAVDLKRRVVRIGDCPIQLTTAEYELLKVFVVNAGRLLTQHRLAYEAWGQRSDEEASQLLRTTIRTLRQKLESNPTRPRYIVMEPGVGYRLRIEP